MDVRLIGDSSIRISPIKIDYKVHNFNNSVLYVCRNGYVFEKRYNDICYTFSRLIIPPYVKEYKISHFFTFLDDQIRYNALKKFANNLVEFTGSGFFGDNPNSRLLIYDNKWFVY